jgi:2-oxoisovalerate dehydrogenase E1 component alpha subunit
MFEERLLKADYLKTSDVKEMWAGLEAAGVAAQTQARTEPVPQPETIWDHVYFGGENADWRKF